MMKNFPLCRRAFLPVAFLLSIAGSAAAQTRVIRTTTGKEYVCRVLSADSEKLMVKMEGRRALRYFGRDSIRSIRSLPREEKEGRYDMLTLALEGGYSYRGRIFASTGDCSLNGVQCAGEGMPWHDMTDGLSSAGPYRVSSPNPGGWASRQITGACRSGIFAVSISVPP